MATKHYDFSAGVNGTGTAASPFNTFVGATIAPGDFILFKRGTTSDVTNMTLTAGTVGNVVTYGAYYNLDSSDDTTLARPIINQTAVMSTFANHRNYVTVRSWDIRAPLVTVANDASVIFVGTGSTVTDCIIDTNVGALGSYSKNNVTMTSNTLRGVSHTSANANNVLIVSGAANMDTIAVTDNTVLHYNGGNANSNAMRIESTIGAVGTGLTNLNVARNTIRPAHNFQRMVPGSGYVNETEATNQGIYHGYGVLNEPTFVYCKNHSAIGIRTSRATNGMYDANNIEGMLEGIWFSGNGKASACTMQDNILNWNMHFGIHLTTDAIGCTLYNNECSYNGINISDGVLFAYGRGIECSGAAGQARCSSHNIIKNTCNYNFNWGGPLDNSTEGVGIGIDDSTYNCLIMRNTLIGNEGNGVQHYGGAFGGGTPVITDTGLNHVVANYFRENCTMSFTDRQIGGTFTNRTVSHVSLGTTIGSPTVIANNVFDTGTTEVAVAQDSLCGAIIIANNILIGTTKGIMFSTLLTPYGCFNNDFFGAGIVKYTSNAVDGNGECTYPALAFSGVADSTFDPLLDSEFRPQTGSPAIGAGYFVGSGFTDFDGIAWLNPPDIGMFEVSASGGEGGEGGGDGGGGGGAGAGASGAGTSAGHGGPGVGDEYISLPEDYWDDREARLKANFREPPDPPFKEATLTLSMTPPKYVIDEAIASQLKAAEDELFDLNSNLMKSKNVAELTRKVERLRALRASIPLLRGKLHKWLPAKFN